jgi:hypothetical protein
MIGDKFSSLPATNDSRRTARVEFLCIITILI